MLTMVEGGTPQGDALAMAVVTLVAAANGSPKVANLLHEVMLEIRRVAERSAAPRLVASNMLVKG